MKIVFVMAEADPFLKTGGLCEDGSLLLLCLPKQSVRETGRLKDTIQEEKLVGNNTCHNTLSGYFGWESSANAPSKSMNHGYVDV